MKKGTIKAFKNYLNEKYKGAKHKNYQYRQTKREYGDYLYNQDRVMFDENLRTALIEDTEFIKIVEKL